jgi:hypothetical protein
MGFAGTGDFNQMQMMMAMQNGSFNGFPMMGMFPTPSLFRLASCPLLSVPCHLPEIDC